MRKHFVEGGVLFAGDEMSKYSFKKYEINLPKLFQREKNKLKKIIPNSKIEHIGSTSIPGLGGKGIIDIAIFTPKKMIKKYMKCLENIGYSYKPHPGDDKRKFMQKIIKYSGKERRIHIHLTLDKEFWNSFLAFRNYLRENKSVRDEYAKIKKEGARKSNGSGEKYFSHKKDFLKRIVKIAKENLG